MNYIKEYYKAILNGEVKTSNKVEAVYKKLVEEIETKNEQTQYIFDEKLANRAVYFIENFCCQTAGKPNTPLKLMLWQKAFVSALFGFIDRETGKRRFKEVLLVIGRKNGKTALASAIILYLLVADFEFSPEIYIVANNLTQAKRGFNEVLKMVNQNSDFNAFLKKRKDDLFNFKNQGVFMPLTSNANGLDGKNSHCILLDEIHEMTDTNLYSVMKQSTSSQTRQQPLLISITTNGFKRNGVFDNLYNYAEQIINGNFEDKNFLPLIYEIEKEDDWENEEVWEKANPGLGVIKSKEALQSFVNKAKNDNSFKGTVLAKDFNLPQNRVDAWLPFEVFNNKNTFDLSAFSGSYCIGGVDLSKTTDLTAVSILMMKKGCKTKYIYQHFFIPKETAEQHIKTDKVPYNIWQEKGYITFTEGSRVDLSTITKWFVNLMNEYKIIPLFVGYDPWASTYWVNEMKDNGFDLIEVRQGFKTISPAMKEIEIDLKDKLINYNNNPITKWCISNVVAVRDDNDNIKFDKVKTGFRVDGFSALVCNYHALSVKINEYLALISDK